MKFHITDINSFISKTEQKKVLYGMQLVTYRVYHDIETERHHNAVLVDQEGSFRGYIDAYIEDITVLGKDETITSNEIDKESKKLNSDVKQKAIQDLESIDYRIRKALKELEELLDE